MSKALMEAVFERQLPPPEKHVLTVMAWFGSDDGTNIFPSIPVLCQRTGYKRSNMQKIIAKLKQRGALVPEGRRAGRNRRGFVPIYRMDLSGLPMQSLDSAYPGTHYQVASNALAVTGALQPESVHSERESVHDSRIVCTTGAESVYSSTPDQYLAVKEQEKRLVAPNFSISHSQNQPQEQKQRLPEKGKATATSLARALGASKRFPDDKSPLVDDEAYERRMAELRTQAVVAQQIADRLARLAPVSETAVAQESAGEAPKTG